MGPLFESLAERDPHEAHLLAAGISHRGLSSLAQLAIARSLFREIRNIKKENINPSSRPDKSDK
jgi:hypothetical protein